ncbi:MAG TPA: phosphatidylserine/phosphatidylglycerophosphate/cardiolipin synthase family protein, partial [Candidatus Obscuribacterales bacterium]
MQGPLQSTLQSAQPGQVFRPEDQVCEPDEMFEEVSDNSSVMPSGRAKANMSLDEIDAESDLHLAVSDRNGLNNRGRNDISGTLDGTVSLSHNVLYNALHDLVGTKAGSAKITGMRFDSASQSYVLSLKTPVLKVLHDNFELKIRTNAAGQLYLQVDENWVPDSSVISRIRDALQGQVKDKINGQQDIVALKLDTRRDGDKLYLTPVLDGIKVPLAKGEALKIEGLNSGDAAGFAIDSQGNLHVKFDNLRFSGSSDAKGAKAPLGQGKADTADLQIYGNMHKDHSSDVTVQGHISLDLDAKDTQKIAFGGESLGKRVESTRLEADIDTDVSIDAHQRVQAQSRNHWRFEDAKIQGRRYDIVSEQIEVSLDTQSGLKLDVKTLATKPTNFKPQLTQNVVEPFIDGPAYYAEMLKAIGGARESIEQETFLMYAGEKTQTLMRALALKAVGLKEGSKNKQGITNLVTDPIAAKGIPVHVLFNNNKQTHEGALPTIQQFEATVKALEDEINKLKVPAKTKQEYIERLHANLKWASIERGVAKADHRKVLIIDGQTGYTGGINMGNHFLQKDSYHDIMLKANGPAVREMQDAFIDNWKDFSPSEELKWNRKSVKELEQHRDRYAKEHHLKPTGTDVVTTDERSSEIEAAYLHAIEHANHDIYVEQAYYFYPPVQEALKRALARGVTLHMIVPERSDEELFDIINLEQIRDLMVTQARLGRGKVEAYLYTGTDGKYSHTAHTKALSADGQMAVVGSANLLPRSLRSPFTEDMPDGSKRQVLFNEEMSLYLEGAQVKTLEGQLFEADKKKSRKIDYDEVLERI